MPDALTTSPHATPPHERLVLPWTRATFAGWALGFLLMLLIIAVSGAVGLGDTQSPVGLGMGLGVGALQGRLIAARGIPRGAWLRATALGVVMPFLVYDVVNLVAADVGFRLPALVVLGGLTAGALQYRLVRHHPGAAWWIPASTAGWTMAGATVVFNDRYLPRIPGIAGALLFVAVILVGGVALGLVGGLAIDRILGRAESDAPA